ncbi:MAG: hypothetical protein ACKOQ5_00325, partial [Solirubrobacterales bacterium]
AKLPILVNTDSSPDEEVETGSGVGAVVAGAAGVVAKLFGATTRNDATISIGSTLRAFRHAR